MKKIKIRMEENDEILGGIFIILTGNLRKRKPCLVNWTFIPLCNDNTHKKHQELLLDARIN